MADIISMADWQKRTRDDLTAEIMHHDKRPMSDTETDRLLSALNKLAAKAPMADEEKIVVFWTKLVEHLAAIDDEAAQELCKTHHHTSQSGHRRSGLLLPSSRCADWLRSTPQLKSGMLVG